MGSAGHQRTAQGTGLFPPFFQLCFSFLSMHVRYGLQNSSQGIGVPVLYLIHSVLLDSILTAKALGVICRAERSESHR